MTAAILMASGHVSFYLGFMFFVLRSVQGVHEEKAFAVDLTEAGPHELLQADGLQPTPECQLTWL